MKFKITTSRLENKFPQGSVVETNEGEKSPLYGIMMALVGQGEAEIEGAPKKKVIKKKIIKKMIKKKKK